MTKQQWNYANTGKNLYEFEEACFEDLADINICGWNAWRVVKTTFFFKIIYSASESKLDERKKSRVSKEFFGYFRLFKAFSHFIYKLSLIFFKNLLEKRDVFIITTSANKTLRYEKNKVMDSVVDHLVLDKSIKSLVYAEIPDSQGRNKLKAVIKSDFLLSDLLLINVILLKFLKRKDSYSNQANKLATLWSNNFKENCPLSTEEIQLVLLNFRIETLVYERLYKIIKPRLVLLNDQAATGKVAAAKKLNIKAIELQHGLMDEYYPQYQLHYKFKTLKEKLPLADKIGVFGEFHKLQLVSKGFYSDDDLFIAAKPSIKTETTFLVDKGEKECLLFVTQGKLLFNQTKHHLLALVNNLDFKKFKLIVKIHPLEPDVCSNWFRSSLLKENYDIRIIQAEYSINEILPSVDSVIGYNSTVLLEAVYHKKQVYSLIDDACPNGIFSIIGNDSRLSKSIRIVQDVKMLMLELNKPKMAKAIDKNISHYLFQDYKSIDYESFFN